MRVDAEKLYRVIPILKEIHLKLPDRPLTFLDVESTGEFPEVDRVVELFMIRVDNPDRLHIFHSLFNPGVPISEEATEIHKISNEDVKDAGPFSASYEKIWKYLHDSCLCGYNLKAFDVKILQKELDNSAPVSDIKVDGVPIIDMYKIWLLQERRTLADAYKRYTGKELTDAHRASDDVFASAEILAAQLEQHQFDNLTVSGLSEFCEARDVRSVDLEGKFRWRGNDIVFTFGDKRGKSLKDVDRGYLSWMLRAGFHEDTKRVIRAHLAGQPIPRPQIKK